jgi:hypothetical protein
MTKEIEDRTHALYEELMEKPREVYQIFIDFFGVDRVDMQGFPTENEFIHKLSVTRIVNIVPSFNVIRDSSEYRSSSKEDQDIIESFWNKESCYNTPVLSDDTLAKYYLSVMKESIGYKLFNELFILVHFPEVRITNEYDKYVDIKHLWAKVMFNWEGKGKGGFGLNRSHYPINHFKSNYMHSHMGGIPKSDFTYFGTPCTGSGPINTTMATLAIGYDEAIWQLFCLELDRYVRVESIAGTPYYRLEQILSSEETNVRSDFTNRAIKREIYTSGVLMFNDFVKYLLSNKILPFNYINGSYSVAMSYVDCVVAVSNTFIEWHNDLYLNGTVDYKLPDLLSNKTLIKAIIKGGEIHYVTVRDGDIREASRYNGEHICFFKGEDITLVIDGAAEDNDNSTILLNPDYVEEIVFRLLLVLNYRYGREDREETTGLGKKVQYI